jgi:hypothetical protein
MNRLRFTLAQLMAIVLFIGFGFAALRSASVLWASAVFTLTVAVLSVAVLGAMARRGRARMTWAGFALLGWVYFGTTFGPWADGNGVKAPPYVTRWVLDYTTAWLWDPNRLDTRVRIDTGVPGEVLFSPFPTWGIGGGMSGGMGSRGIAAAGPGPPRDAFHFRRIGHCLAAILFGLAGAVSGRLLAPRDEQPNS